MTFAHDEFDVDLAARTVVHTASGIRFAYYEYSSAEDWYKAGPSHMGDNASWGGDRGALAVAAKAAANTAGMRARRAAKPDNQLAFEPNSQVTPEGALELVAFKGRNAYRAYLTADALSTASGGQARLSPSQIYRWASANIQALSHIASRMFEDGEGFQQTPNEPPYVILSPDDLYQSGENFSALTPGVELIWHRA